MWDRIFNAVTERTDMSAGNLKSFLDQDADKVYELTSEDDTPWGFNEYVCAETSKNSLADLLAGIPEKSKIPHLQLASLLGEKFARGVRVLAFAKVRTRSDMTDALTSRF
ncbi:MAG: hypothetical protein AAB515_00860 [Patescibacteria group bacterium]